MRSKFDQLMTVGSYNKPDDKKQNENIKIKLQRHHIK